MREDEWPDGFYLWHPAASGGRSVYRALIHTRGTVSQLGMVYCRPDRYRADLPYSIDGQAVQEHAGHAGAAAADQEAPGEVQER